VYHPDSSIERAAAWQDFQKRGVAESGLIVCLTLFAVGQFAADARGADETRKDRA